MDEFCRQKGVEHALDHRCDSLDSVASGIFWRLYGWWAHSYPAGHRHRRGTDSSYSGTKMIIAIWNLAGSGFVNSRQAVDKAGQIARSVKGVKSVKNNLIVK